ncbi:MAG: hypothetical protein R3B45_10075 [Bdellovibrionota bacterium]
MSTERTPPLAQKDVELSMSTERTPPPAQKDVELSMSTEKRRLRLRKT